MSNFKRYSIVVILTILPSIAQRQERSCSAYENNSRVNIRIKSSASVSDRIALIEDIADVASGNLSIRRRIQKLDIAEPPAAGETATITKSQLQLRLLLGGISAQQFQITGADQCRLAHESAQKLDETSILELTRHALAEQLQIAEKDLVIRPLRPLRIRYDLSGSSSRSVMIKPYLPETVRPGAISVRIAVYIDDKLREVATWSLEVKVYRNVAKAARRIQRGEAFTNHNITNERIALTDAAFSQLATGIIGQRARHEIRLGEVIYARDLVNRSTAKEPVLIRSRDVVTLVARKGALKVTISDGMAIESGKLGDSIKVRNPKSNRIVTGRIAGRTVVEVPF